MSAVGETLDTPAPVTIGPLSLAVYASGLRCVFTYAVLPGLAPVLGAFVVVALPVLLALYALGIGASVRAIRRCVGDGRVTGAVLAAVLLSLNVLSLLVVLGRA